MPESESCQTCRFWKNYGNVHGDGECRRHAPSILETGSAPYADTTHARYPLVSDCHWCGDYEKAAL